MGQFKLCYPNVFDDIEAAAFAEMAAISRAIADRGPVDPKRLVSGGYPAGTAGIPESAVVSEALVRYYNGKYLPDQPIYNDDAYAKAAAACSTRAVSWSVART